MATSAMDYEVANSGDRYEDEGPRYERDNRSVSPRRDDDREDVRRRSASPSGNDRASAPKDDTASRGGDDEGAVNPGSNLFVTGIHPNLTEPEVGRLFEKYGEVEKCQIMRDPHTKESRGFGFVKMVTSDQADAAKEGLQGEQIDGRTLSIEKARRARPRTPTPGKYFGPPKREPRGRFDDRRRGGPGGYGGYRDDPYRYRGRGYYDRPDDRSYGRDGDRGYDRGYREDRGYPRSYRDDDRGYGRGYERRGDREEGYAGGRGGERYSRDDRGGYDREDRRGGGYERDRYDRAPRSREPPSGGYAADPAPRGEPRDSYGALP